LIHHPTPMASPLDASFSLTNVDNTAEVGGNCDTENMPKYGQR